MGREPLLVQVPTAYSLMMRGRWAELTDRQQHFLVNAHDCTPPHARAVKHGWTGLGAKGPSIGVASRLERLGYVEYVGHGRLEDDDNGDAERPIYAITEDGRSLLRAVGEIDEPASPEIRSEAHDTKGQGK